MAPRWTYLGVGLAFLLMAGWVVYLYLAPFFFGGHALAPDDPAVVAAGQRVYVAECASCHGADLEGQPSWRERKADGRLPAPPHDASGHTWHHPDAQLIALTKYGPAAMAGSGYESDMPAYQDQLSDEEIVAVLSYIKSTWPAEIRARHDALNQRAAQR